MKHSLEDVTKLIPSQEAFNAGPGRIKKHFDIYKPIVWKRDKEREKRNYPNEPDPLYWDYVDTVEESAKYPRVINLKK